MSFQRWYSAAPIPPEAQRSLAPRFSVGWLHPHSNESLGTVHTGPLKRSACMLRALIQTVRYPSVLRTLQ